MELYETSAVHYINNLLSGLQGRKALLVDEPMKQLLTVSYSHTMLLAHEVFLVDLTSKITRPKNLTFLNCIILCRPTADAINAISSELGNPSFGKYHIYFANMADQTQLELLVNADKYHCVEHVEEVFLDAHPVTDSTCTASLNEGVTSAFRQPQYVKTADEVTNRERNPLVLSQTKSEDIQRMVQSIVAMALASRRRPTIRYSGNSQICERIAKDLSLKMQSVHKTFFELRSKDCVLLLLDRHDDPVTPLLTQWTYEAMMHELIPGGIFAGMVDLGIAKDDEEDEDDWDKLLDAPLSPNLTKVQREEEIKKRQDTVKAKKAQREAMKHILSATADSFFGAHRNSDWGEVCLAVKDAVDAYKQLNNIDLRTASFDDFQEFVAKVPDAQKQSLMVLRHASICAEIGGIVGRRRLPDMSQVEQEIVARTHGNNNPNDHMRAALEAITNKDTSLDDCVRLVMLYAIRYEQHSRGPANLEKLKEALVQRGCSASKLQRIDQLLNYGGAKNRATFQTSSGGSSGGTSSDSSSPSGVDLFQVPHWQTGLLKTFKRVMPSFGFGTDDQQQPAKNILTQHKPLLHDIICALQNGLLKESEYPFAPGQLHSHATQEDTRCKDVFVFIVGGATYEEARLVTQINQSIIENSAPGLGERSATGSTQQDGAAALANHQRSHSAPGNHNMLKGITGRIRRLGTAGDDIDDHDSAAAVGSADFGAGPSSASGGQFSEKLECHVLLGSTSMLSAEKFMAALP